MAIKKRVSGAWVDVTTAKKRVAGAWVNMTSAKVRVAGAWVEKMFIALTASASPTSVSGLVSSITIGNKTVTSNSTTVTPANGTGGSKTYSWAFVSGESMTVSSPTSATTTFSKSLSPGSGPHTAVYRCTVNDGTFTATADVNVQLECTYDPE